MMQKEAKSAPERGILWRPSPALATVTVVGGRDRR